MWRGFDTDPAVYRRPPETLRRGSRGLSGGDRRGQKDTHRTRSGESDSAASIRSHGRDANRALARKFAGSVGGLRSLKEAIT